MQKLVRPWVWAGLNPTKRNFGNKVRAIFKDSGFEFIVLTGKTGQFGGPGAMKLHLPNYTLVPLASATPSVSVEDEEDAEYDDESAFS
jgi:hypothetical protein